MPGALLNDGLVQVAAGIATAAIIGVVVALGKWYKSHQDTARKARSLSEFFFDQPADPSGVPGRKGWTTVTDERLDALEDKPRA